VTTEELVRLMDLVRDLVDAIQDQDADEQPCTAVDVLQDIAQGTSLDVVVVPPVGAQVRAADVEVGARLLLELVERGLADRGFYSEAEVVRQVVEGVVEDLLAVTTPTVQPL